MSEQIEKVAGRIIREAIEGIEALTIAEAADDGMDVEDLEKRVRNAVVHIYIPTESGCVCIGLSHQRECPEWRMPW